MYLINSNCLKQKQSNLVYYEYFVLKLQTQYKSIIPDSTNTLWVGEGKICLEDCIKLSKKQGLKKKGQWGERKGWIIWSSIASSMRSLPTLKVNESSISPSVLCKEKIWCGISFGIRVTIQLHQQSKAFFIGRHHLNLHPSFYTVHYIPGVNNSNIMAGQKNWALPKA